MDPLDNPYSPGAGVAPEKLPGRGDELTQFGLSLARMRRGRAEQSVIVTGLRGVGKTVLLNRFEEIAVANDFIPFYHELTPDADLLPLIGRDLKTALLRLKLSAKAKESLRAALAHLSMLKVTVADDVEISILPGIGDEQVLTADLTDLFLEIGAAARERDQGIAFLLDELQFISEVEYRALISALHRANCQRRLPITMAAGGLPQIPKLSGEARSYAERLFQFRAIGKLARVDAEQALVEPAGELGVAYSRGALAAALEWSDDYPFFLQLIGKYCWNAAAKSPISEPDVKQAVKLAQDDLDNGFYRVRLQRVSPEELRYLRAMASLGSGPYVAGDIIKAFKKTHQQSAPIRQRLIEKGLIYPTEEHGRSDFTVPGFAAFLNRL